jgi:transcriptional antiterminator NusG
MPDTDQTTNTVPIKSGLDPSAADGGLRMTGEKGAESLDDEKRDDDSPATVDEQIKADEDSRESTAYHVILKKHRDPAAKWYVIHTYSGHEENVAQQLNSRVNALNLTHLIHEALVPTQDKIKIVRGKKQTIKEKIFPGYILVKLIFNDDSWMAVRNTPSITGFVGIGKNPTPIPETEVDTIQKFAAQQAPKFVTAFSLDEAVKISDGPFAEFLGTVSSIDETKGKLTVLVSIFGRETPVELDFLQVAKI